ncbi:MAG: hypothetical protein J5648_09265 [Lachnospiraceae bacterium]|nr:hypothetical protein [Lachnospiraceae bacterium]
MRGEFDETYLQRLMDAVRYYRVNYVEGGSHPILEESKGIITLKPLEYREQFYRDWRG